MSRPAGVRTPWPSGSAATTGGASACGGLFDRGSAYDPGELHPVFVSRDEDSLRFSGAGEAFIAQPGVTAG